MSDCVIFDNGDGTVSVLRPFGNRDLETVAKRHAAGRTYQIVDDSNVPTDRTFREAWTAGASGVDVDMPRARAIHLAKIRKERDSRFPSLDQEFAKHDAQARYNADAAAVEKARQAEIKRKRLRDAPQSVASAIGNAATLEELKAIWPAALSD